MNIHARSAVLVVAFKRPDLLHAVLDQVAKSGDRRVYISVDAPRTAVDEVAVREVLDVAKAFGSAHVRAATQNLGSGRHLVQALTWVMSSEETVIVLEDDCIPGDDFFSFMDHELANRRPGVMTVSGYNPVPIRLLDQRSAWIGRYPLTWGWATWRDAWELYSYQLKDWENALPITELRRIAQGDAWFVHMWKRKFDGLREGSEKIWDYQWVYANWRHQGAGVYPPVNLIQNHGFGVRSTHSFYRRRIYSLPSVRLPSTYDPKNQALANRKADSYLHVKFYHGGLLYPPKGLIRRSLRFLARIRRDLAVTRGAAV